MPQTKKKLRKKEGAAEKFRGLPYSWILIPQEDGGFAAEILEFPGCFSEGATPKEAFDNLAEAAKNWVESCQEAGCRYRRPSPTMTTAADSRCGCHEACTPAPPNSL